MENETTILKAVADETRINILKLLLKHNLCVGALSGRLNLTEAAISQHLKVLREAGLITGEKRGYFMHYQVNRELLAEISKHFKELSEIEQEVCDSNKADCATKHKRSCHSDKTGKKCSEETKKSCHGADKTEGSAHESCKCCKS